MSLYGIFIIFGVLGNCLIVLAVLLRERMRTARNVFILTLAVSDIFLCVIAMPSTLWEVSAQKCVAAINILLICLAYLNIRFSSSDITSRMASW